MYVDDETRLRHMLDAAREASGFARDNSRADLEVNRLLAFGLVKRSNPMRRASRLLIEHGLW